MNLHRVIGVIVWRLRTLLAKVLPEGTWSDRRKFLTQFSSALAILGLSKFTWETPQPIPSSKKNYILAAESGSYVVTPGTAHLNLTGHQPEAVERKGELP